MAKKKKKRKEEEEEEKYLNKPKCELEGRCVGSCHLVGHLGNILGDFLSTSKYVLVFICSP